MAAASFTVEYVSLDEATPRDLHTVTVDADNAEEAKLLVWTQMQLAGDRVSVTDVRPVAAS